MLRFLLAFALAGPALAAEDADYRIGPRDVVEVEVYGEPDLSKEFEVSGSGAITVPFLGSIEVRGLTPSEAATRLSDGWKDGILINPQVTVRIAEHRSQQVEVYGAVKKPGPYYMDGPTTLLEVLGRAGWVDAKTSSNMVIVRRDTGDVVSMTLEEVKGGETNFQLMRGDEISVEEGQLVYIGGEVEKAGPVVFVEGLTVMQALLRAGGPKETARLRGAYIVRNGEKLPVNLRRISDGRESDLVMQPGDQLFLKESPL